mmetsp:Transcript_42715/g.91050  ORF Transcript_42715/g.91050 Transcript_42715/m.91050 type:complete len:209 (+) Transcript_42715:73-699(+)
MANTARVSTTFIMVLLSTATLVSCARLSVSDNLAVEDTCGAVDGAQARKSEPSLCKCSYKEKVFCEADAVAERKFNLTEVLDTPGCYAPYCAVEADPARSTTSTTTTTTTTTTEPTTTTTTTTMAGPTIIDFGDSKLKIIDGGAFKCCCRSEVLSKPGESTKIVCELVEAPEDVGCRQLKGPGYHSWNNMGTKYEGLEHFNECAIPPS